VGAPSIEGPLLMPIKTATSMSGFVATTPQLTVSEAGEPRAWMRVGQEHYVRNMDGSFTEQEPTFHDLVVFRKTAEHVAAKFAKGDRFVAEGYVHTYDSPNAEGAAEQREEFVARKIGHDAARTDYQVDRTPRVQQGPTNTCDLQPAPASGDPVAVGM